MHFVCCMLSVSPDGQFLVALSVYIILIRQILLTETVFLLSSNIQTHYLDNSFHLTHPYNPCAHHKRKYYVYTSCYLYTSTGCLNTNRLQFTPKNNINVFHINSLLNRQMFLECR